MPVREQSILRTCGAVFQFCPQGQIVTHTSEVGPQGWILSTKDDAIPTVLLNKRECSPPGLDKGVNMYPRGQSSPWGPSLLLGTNFTTEGKLASCGNRGKVQQLFLHFGGLVNWIIATRGQRLWSNSSNFDKSIWTMTRKSSTKKHFLVNFFGHSGPT
jgi:hypothetical protein